MKSHFARPERATPEAVAREVERLTRNPVVDELLETTCGWIALLNRERQILTVNTSFLEALGIGDAAAVIGLRPGEAVGCVRATEGEGGCGTGPSCSSCGAAIALVAACEDGRPAERTCAMEVARGGRKVDLCLRVHAAPVTLGGQSFVMVVMQDITAAERRAALERVFFHDLANVIQGLSGVAELMAFRGAAGGADRLIPTVGQIADRLASEVRVQRALLRDEEARAVLDEEITPAAVLGELQGLFSQHPAALGRDLLVRMPLPGPPLRTDPSLLLRVLGNMVVNALEASAPGETVRVWVEETPGEVVFSVWNRAPIPPAVARRVFQRHFTTRDGPGRGLGTYGMKLLGERHLGGRVAFATSDAEGTTFTLRLPAR